ARPEAALRARRGGSGRPDAQGIGAPGAVRAPSQPGAVPDPDHQQRLALRVGVGEQRGGRLRALPAPEGAVARGRVPGAGSGRRIPSGRVSGGQLIVPPPLSLRRRLPLLWCAVSLVVLVGLELLSRAVLNAQLNGGVDGALALVARQYQAEVGGA